MGDAAWTREALTNVLKNCVEHTPAGGTVSITAHEDAVACRIRVEDTGPGIAEKDLPHVFERFRQVDNFLTRRHQGTGLGLALVHELVGLMGGEVRVRSEEGKGSEFVVTLPIDGVPATPA